MLSIDRFKATLVAGAAMALFAAKAESVPTITFDDGGLGVGVISFDGGSANPAYTSLAIQITNVSSNSETPFNPNDNFTCDGCLLEFQTGNTASQSGNEYVWTGDGGSFFTITGRIQALCIGYEADCVTEAAVETLLEGTFDEARFFRIGQQWFFTGVGPDDKHPVIVDHFFGVDTLPFSFGNTEIASAGDVVITPTTGPDSFVANIDQADVTNQQTIPEPATGLLVLLGLMSIAGRAAARRRS